MHTDKESQSSSDSKGADKTAANKRKSTPPVVDETTLENEKLIVEAREEQRVLRELSKPQMAEASAAINEQIKGYNAIRQRLLIHTDTEREDLEAWSEENDTIMEKLFAGFREGTVYICDTIEPKVQPLILGAYAFAREYNEAELTDIMHDMLGGLMFGSHLTHNAENEADLTERQFCLWSDLFNLAIGFIRAQEQLQTLPEYSLRPVFCIQ